MFTGSGVFTDTGMDLTLWYIVHRLVKCSCAASEDSARDSVYVLVWIGNVALRHKIAEKILISAD